LSQCPNYLTLNQEKIVNDLEFCENLNTVEAQLEGGQTDLIINGTPLQLTGQTPVPGGGEVSAILIAILGNYVPLFTSKNSNFTVGLRFTQSQPNPFPLFGPRA
jgi:hypothetical protein